MRLKTQIAILFHVIIVSEVVMSQMETSGDERSTMNQEIYSDINFETLRMGFMESLTTNEVIDYTRLQRDGNRETLEAPNGVNVKFSSVKPYYWFRELFSEDPGGKSNTVLAEDETSSVSPITTDVPETSEDVTSESTTSTESSTTTSEVSTETESTPSVETSDGLSTTTLSTTEDETISTTEDTTTEETTTEEPGKFNSSSATFIDFK